MTIADDIFSAGGLKRATVFIKSLGMEIDVRELTMRERGVIMQLTSDDRTVEIGEFVAQACVPAFADKTVDDIVNSLSPDVIDEIAAAAFKLSGVTEDAEKN